MVRENDLTQEFDVVCLGGGVAAEAIAAGLQDGGLTLAVVERETRRGRVPVLGLHPFEDTASLGRNLERG
jgi:2-polyprenyl-6-methoxyphenol hydroxylase-like FAD-dependent oxidoreductase